MHKSSQYAQGLHLVLRSTVTPEGPSPFGDVSPTPRVRQKVVKHLQRGPVSLGPARCQAPWEWPFLDELGTGRPRGRSFTIAWISPAPSVLEEETL